jgi:glycosyltransferase involved in cell wall biosynthesis
MANPTLALCIPAYNAAAYLPRLLKSAAAQTVPFDEILVYDDCSTDGTSAVAEAHSATVIRGEVNVGCSAGKNRLAEVTTCEWVHFHDADDELYPNFVETARAWMEQDGLPDVVLFAYEYRDNETNELLSVTTFDDEALRRDPVEYTIRQQINPFCGLYRREAFLRAGGYDLDPEVLYNEDVAMHCQLARAGLRFAADPTVTVINYRIGNSMSQGNLDKCLRAHVRVMEKAAELSGPAYYEVAAQKLWSAAGAAGSILEWETAERAARSARRFGLPTPPHSGRAFQLLAAVHPPLALRVREHAIRLFRPHLRASSPAQ